MTLPEYSKRHRVFGSAVIPKGESSKDHIESSKGRFEPLKGHPESPKDHVEPFMGLLSLLRLIQSQ